MARRTTTDAAPAVPDAAAAIVGLLNSRPHAVPVLPDTLDDPKKSHEILAPFGQPAGEPVSAERLAEIRALRSTLTDLIAAPEPPDEAAWQRLTRHASTVTLQQEFSPAGSVRLRQVGGEPLIGAVLLAVAGLVSSDKWSRLRLCANDACRGVFYDTTRSRTQRWHSYEICGNRANLAAYRSRKAATGQVAHGAGQPESTPTRKRSANSPVTDRSTAPGPRA